MSTPPVVRIAVRGWTYRRSRSDNFSEARAMLTSAFQSRDWPLEPAQITVTPGGFIRTRLPRDYDGDRGWESTKCDIDKLIPPAEAAVQAVVLGNVLKAARQRTRFLTLGVDLNRERNKEERIRGDHDCRRTCPQSCTHAELVAVVDTASGDVIHWTGKSYPTGGQQHTLVHVKDLGTHFLKLGDEPVLVLGCHDLHLFSGRGKPSKNGPTPKEKRSRRMLRRARKFKPTMILHHPHTTHSPNVWSGAWGKTRKALPTARIRVSGIAFCGNPKPKRCWTPRQTLVATLAATKSENGVCDIVVEGYGR